MTELLGPVTITPGRSRCIAKMSKLLSLVGLEVRVQVRTRDRYDADGWRHVEVISAPHYIIGRRAKRRA